MYHKYQNIIITQHFHKNKDFIDVGLYISNDIETLFSILLLSTYCDLYLYIIYYILYCKIIVAFYLKYCKFILFNELLCLQ